MRMKNYIIKSLILGLGISILLFGTVFANVDNKGIEKDVDGVKVNISFMTPNAKTGSNDLIITLHDNNEKSISGAIVKLTADMDRTKDAMNSQMSTQPLKVELQSSPEEGQYISKINFTDSGKWMVNVNFTVDGKESMTDFELNVDRAGPNWYVIGGFLGIVAIVIAFAAINKKRRSSQT